ncbi:hypothetical protein [Acidisoma sp. 7E03]
MNAMRAARGTFGRHRESLLLGGLILSLSAAVAVAAITPAPAVSSLAASRRSVAETPLAAEGAAGGDAATADLWMQTTLSRPLFALDRRPAETTARADASLPRLSGTIRFAHTALAIFEVPASGDNGHHSGPPTALGAGAQVGGWTIEDVSDESVRLIKGDETRTLDLAFSQAPPPPPPAAPKGVAALRLLHGKKSNVFWQP